LPWVTKFEARLKERRPVRAARVAPLQGADTSLLARPGHRLRLPQALNAPFQGAQRRLPRDGARILGAITFESDAPVRSL
jgi:hypothetical protein